MADPVIWQFSSQIIVSTPEYHHCRTSFKCEFHHLFQAKIGMLASLGMVAILGPHFHVAAQAAEDISPVWPEHALSSKLQTLPPHYPFYRKDRGQLFIVTHSYFLCKAAIPIQQRLSSGLHSVFPRNF